MNFERNIPPQQHCEMEMIFLGMVFFLNIGRIQGIVKWNLIKNVGSLSDDYGLCEELF
jgi:hypothetical protein